MPIEKLYPFILYILKVPIDVECVYWIKMYLLTKNVSIKWKCVYWPKCAYDQKCTYWMKMCLLKGYNPLGINSSSYLFGNFFLTSFSSSFLET